MKAFIAATIFLASATLALAANEQCGQGNQPPCQGAQGPAGPTGPAGPQGPQGDVGPQGPQGDVGPAGSAGADGAPGANGADGAAGPAGANGTNGIDGAQGPAGADGTNGQDGTPGATGAAGANGKDFDFDRALAITQAASMPVWLGDKENFRVSGGLGFSGGGETAVGATGVMRIEKGVSAFAGGAVDSRGKDWSGKAGLSVGW
jgi:hypothetical protein